MRKLVGKDLLDLRVSELGRRIGSLAVPADQCCCCCCSCNTPKVD
jgi:hypothetical protein